MEATKLTPLHVASKKTTNTSRCNLQVVVCLKLNVICAGFRPFAFQNFRRPFDSLGAESFDARFSEAIALLRKEGGEVVWLRMKVTEPEEFKMYVLCVALSNSRISIDILVIWVYIPILILLILSSEIFVCTTCVCIYIYRYIPKKEHRYMCVPLSNRFI